MTIPIRLRRRPLLAAAAAALPLLLATPARAAPDGWRRWWLPEPLSLHGEKADLLFNVIFVVCAAVMVGVFYYMAKFCLKYRHRPSVAKAHFTHGNKKVELIWTVIPAILLLGLALWTKAAWDDYRYAPFAHSPDRAQILVVAEQFRWNVIYPGPDGKLGRYLAYPKPTDLKWPAMPPDDADDLAATTGVPGPAFLPEAEAQKKLNDYVSTKNPLGKDFDDPDGKDDNFEKFPGRPIHVPKGRPVDIHLTSKDVIHSFFLPDYRVKLDAVPGMRGHIYFTATTSSAEVEKPTRRRYTLDELRQAVAGYGATEYRIVVPAADAEKYVVKTVTTKKVRERGRMVDKEVTETTPVAADGDAITVKMLDELAKLKVTDVEAFAPKRWDLVCQELCGNGHGTMQGALVVLEPDEYAARFEGKSPGGSPAAPATQPTASATD